MKNVLVGLLILVLSVLAYWGYMLIALHICAWLNIGISQNGVIVGSKVISDETFAILLLLPSFLWVCSWIGKSVLR